jgi:Protein of unknown function (DUF2752)
MSLVQGDWTAACRYNPLIFVCYGLTLLVNLYAAAVLLFRLPRLRLANLPATVKRALSATILIALTANWIYLLAHC